MKKLTFFWLISLFLMLFMESCYETTPLKANADFSYTVVDNDYSVPVLIQIHNESTGGEFYEWTFEGGNPATSTDFAPGKIQYTEAGIYTITLKVSNSDDSEDTYSKEVNLLGNLSAAFDTEILINNYAPVEIHITNQTENATGFQWSFQNGQPVSSMEENPPNVVFDTPGEHTISLLAFNSNGDQEEVSTTILVEPPLEVNFTTSFGIEDNDFEVPFTLYTENTSQSATSYTWSAPGSTTPTSTEESPSFTYLNPGNYTLTLTATNGKQTLQETYQFTLYSNSHLNTQENIILGINAAQNTLGCFYSTTTQEVYKSMDVDIMNGSEIDIAFFGLNQDFTFNEFISPAEVATVGFPSIPNANHTLFTNLVESCNCGFNMNVADFDAMTDDTLLQSMNVVNQIQFFDNSTLPRLVPFEREDGKKGVIKVKSFVSAGTASYIVVDIKVQKD